jgi:prepilin-type processing-associated H-X9-DG protein
VAVVNGGLATYYYWVVANYPIGKVITATSTPAYRAPQAFSSSSFVNVGWSLQTGATTYDVLRTTTSSLPAGTSNSAVATGLTVGSFKDTVTSPTSYTLSPLVPTVNGAMSIDNTNFTSPQLIWTLPMVYNFPVNVLIFSDGSRQTTAGGGGGTPGGTNTAVQFNNTGAFGGDATNFNYNSSTHQISASGGFVSGSGSIVDGSVDGTLKLTNNAVSSGIVLDLNTDGLMKVRNRANAAYADAHVNNFTVDGTCTGCGGGGSSTGVIDLSPIVSCSNGCGSGYASGRWVVDGTNYIGTTGGTAYGPTGAGGISGIVWQTTNEGINYKITTGFMVPHNVNVSQPVLLRVVAATADNNLKLTAKLGCYQPSENGIPPGPAAGPANLTTASIEQAVSGSYQFQHFAISWSTWPTNCAADQPAFLMFYRDVPSGTDSSNYAVVMSPMITYATQ